MLHEYELAHTAPAAGHVAIAYEPPVVTDTVDGTPNGELVAGEPTGGHV